MALYLGNGQKVKFIFGTSLYKMDFLSLTHNIKPILGMGKMGYMKIE